MFVFFIIVLIQISSRSTFTVYNYGREDVLTKMKPANVSKESNINSPAISLKSLFGVTNVMAIKKVKDLKANVFDKMLSDEMLSIKQQIFERNTTPASIKLSSKRYVLTPILELQQRWPIDTIESNKEKKLNFEKHMKSMDDTADEEEIKIKEKSDYTTEKILELRSLSEKLHKIDVPTKSARATKHCTCTNGFDHFHSSIHKEIRHTLGHKHVEQISNSLEKCSRTTTTPQAPVYPFYITYSPFFVGTIADYTNVYYHPDAISDLKIPKHHKNRKHKEPVIEDIDNSVEDDGYYDYSEYDDRTKNTRKHKDKTKINKEFKIIVQSTNEPDTSLDDREKIKVVDKDTFVEEIVQDLKIYYNEAVIKDCYCSSSTFQLGLQIIVFVYLLQYLI